MPLRSRSDGRTCRSEPRKVDVARARQLRARTVRRVAGRSRRTVDPRQDQPETPRPSRDAQGGDSGRRDGAAVRRGVLRRSDGAEMTAAIVVGLLVAAAAVYVAAV